MSAALLLARESLLIAAKDLRLEWRNRSRLLAVLLFGLVVLFLFSLALDAETLLAQRAAAGFLVVALLLSSTLALAESFRHERADRALEGILLLPVRPAALFYGKALASTLFLGVLGPILILPLAVLFQLDLAPGPWLGATLVWLLAAAGLAGPGTLYAAMTSTTRSQDVLLPILLFPLELPVLISALRSLDLVLTGDPMGQLDNWLVLLIVFDVLYWALCGILFPFVVEDGNT